LNESTSGQDQTVQDQSDLTTKLIRDLSTITLVFQGQIRICTHRNCIELV